MERFHYDLTRFSSDVILAEDRLRKGLYLCVLHADKVPPHLGIVYNGLFFSAKATGKDERVPVNYLFQIINKRRIKTLFFELTHQLVLEGEVESYFQDFPAYLNASQTCITPIKSILKTPESVIHIGDLLTFLESSKLIKARLTVHLQEDFKGIPYYTIDDINKRIALLKHDKGRKNIPQANGAI
jgi:hypothetical protein